MPASPAALGLSGKQIEVLSLLMQGKSNKAICRALDLAEPTVKYHVTTILKALKAANRTEAVLTVGKFGWKLLAAAEEARAAEGPVAATAGTTRDGSAAEKPRPASLRESVAEPQPGQQALLALPDKPSIVVLPFTNLSGDPSQDYFADGMVEEITVALGRLPWLFVIGSSSAFTYKNRAVDLREVGKELGVRYALRGSVRKEGNRVRIAAELADTLSGGQVWTDRFNGEMDSIFDLQDRVAAQVRTAVSPALRSEEIERAQRKPTGNLTAYDLYLRALPIHRESYADNREALRFLYQAIELDPKFGSAYGLAAHCFDLQKMFGWISPTDPAIEEGVRVARIAAETGRNDSEALWMAGHTLVLVAGEPEEARPLIERALSLNPNSPNAWWVSGTVHNHTGAFEVALDHLAQARRLSPFDPLSFAHWISTATGHFFAGRYQDALAAADRSLGENSAFAPALRFKIATCGLLGRVEEGRECVERLLRINPGATVKSLAAYYAPLRRHNQRSIEELLRGLRLAGLPEDETS